MGSNRTLVLPLCPHADQEKKLNLILSASRSTYNDLMEHCRDIVEHNNALRKARMDCDDPWGIEGLSPKQDYLPFPSEFDLMAMAGDLREINLWRREAYSTSVRETGSRISKTFSDYFRRLGKGEHPGLPRFKSAGSFHTFTYTASDQYSFDPDWLEGTSGAKIRLGGVGEVTFKNEAEARLVQSKGILKQAQVKKKRYGNKDRWYLMIYYDTVEPRQYGETVPGEPFKDPVGIDVGARKTAVMSDGTIVDNPCIKEKHLKERARIQRRISATDKGSPERRKLLGRLRHLDDHIGDTLNDMMHKVTRKIALEHDLIVMEDLKVADINNLDNNRKTHREFSDARPGLFRRMLGYKAEEAGSEIIRVNPAYTSQTCSACGKRADPGSNEMFVCSHCSCTLDRDLNASRNILGRGIRLVIRGTSSLPESQRKFLPMYANLWCNSG